MADNNTAFILEEWGLTQEPGMQCRPHHTIIGMLAAYNIVAVIVSVVIASPFFYRQKQHLLAAVWRLWRQATRSQKQEEGSEQEQVAAIPYSGTTWLAFIASVVGSVGLSLAAPLLAGITITRDHPKANYWIVVQQWATRPRAALLVCGFNLLFATSAHRGLIMGQSQDRLRQPQQVDGYLETAIVAVVADIFISVLPLKFLNDQTQVQGSPALFESSTPCTNWGGLYGSPSDCPDMEIGAFGLFIITIFNTVAGCIALIILALSTTTDGFVSLRRYALFMSVGWICPFVMYIYSWMIWKNFLESAPDSMYCVQASALVDVVYLLLPIVLGVWRLACSCKAQLARP